MTQTLPDLDRLHALAKAATPEEWWTEVDNVFAGPPGPDSVYVANCAPFGSPVDGHPATVANAAYIDAAQPSTVMWMIDRIRALEAETSAAAMNQAHAAAYPHLIGAQYRVAPVHGGWSVQCAYWLAEGFFGSEAKAVAERARLIAADTLASNNTR